MWTRMCLALAAGVLTCSAATAADGAAEVCSDAFAREDYEQARQTCAPVAEKGNCEALFVMGDIYAEGLGVEADDEKAKEFRRRAAAVARGETENFDKRTQRLMDKVASGDVQAMLQLASNYMRGYKIEEDPKKGVDLYKQAAEKGSTRAMRKLGDMHRKGEHLDADPNRAFVYYQMAAEKGDPRAVFDTAEMYMEGAGVECDPYQADLRFQLDKAAGGRIITVRGDPVEKLAKELKDDQIAKAERVARDWKRGQPLPDEARGRQDRGSSGSGAPKR